MRSPGSPGRLPGRCGRTEFEHANDFANEHFDRRDLTGSSTARDRRLLATRIDRDYSDYADDTSDTDAPAAGKRFGPIAWIWVVVAVVYAALFRWYTSFGGPLSDEEIAGYLAAMQRGDPSSAPEDLARIRRFMEEDTGDDFAMLNVIGRYMQYMWPALLSRASHPVFSGSAANTAMDLMNAPGWTCGRAEP